MKAKNSELLSKEMGYGYNDQRARPYPGWNNADDFFQMNDDERKDWREQVAAKAKAAVFSIGQPLVYKEKGKMVAEYADGRLTIL